jgi:hypothetical protein
MAGFGISGAEPSGYIARVRQLITQILNWFCLLVVTHCLFLINVLVVVVY